MRKWALGPEMDLKLLCLSLHWPNVYIMLPNQWFSGHYRDYLFLHVGKAQEGFLHCDWDAIRRSGSFLTGSLPLIVWNTAVLPSFIIAIAGWDLFRAAAVTGVTSVFNSSSRIMCHQQVGVTPVSSDVLAPPMWQLIFNVDSNRRNKFRNVICVIINC